MRSLGKVSLLVALAVAGGVAGLVGSFVHDVSTDVLGVGLPSGLLLALGLAASAFVLAGWALRNRLAVLAPGMGWLVPVLVMSVPRAEGDLVVVFQSGAYGATASPQDFLGHPACAEVLV